MKKTTTTIAIARSRGLCTCKRCGYSIGRNRTPRGELYLLVSGGGKLPRPYHFGCYESALCDYESGLNLQEAR